VMGLTQAGEVLGLTPPAVAEVPYTSRRNRLTVHTDRGARVR
jgi:hypothetical protein